MNRIHIIGRKNSGKTTLIVELVSTLVERGYRVATIKHTHHDHELDTPGKDSHRHREAGASAVGILTKGMNAIFWPQTDRENGAQKYGKFDSMMSDCDFVIVEGDTQTDATKIEVFRAINGGQPLVVSDPSIRAVITDDTIDSTAPTWPRTDVGSIISNIETLFPVKSKRDEIGS